MNPARPSALVLALLLLPLFPARPLPARETPPAEGPPEAVVERILRSGARGLPTGPTWETLEPLLSADFALVIRRAQEVQARFRREFPEDKPPWIEGDFFSSLFEGPTGFTVGKPALEGAGTRARVPVAMEHAADGTTTRWTDTFLLVRERGAWRLDDVEFGGTWDFAARGSLKDALRESLEEEP
jgi:hypothetical protein